MATNRKRSKTGSDWMTDDVAISTIRQDNSDDDIGNIDSIGGQLNKVSDLNSDVGKLNNRLSQSKSTPVLEKPQRLDRIRPQSSHDIKRSKPPSPLVSPRYSHIRGGSTDSLTVRRFESTHHPQESVIIRLMNFISRSSGQTSLTVTLYDDDVILSGIFSSTGIVKKEASKSILAYGITDYSMIYRVDDGSGGCEICCTKSYDVSLPVRFDVSGVESPDCFEVAG